MNDEPSVNLPAPRRSLAGRPAPRPELGARLHHLLDTLQHSIADGCDAHATAERVIAELRQLGQEVLGQWAQEAQAQVPKCPSARAPARGPGPR